MVAQAASGMMLGAVQDALNRRLQRGIANDQTQIAQQKIAQEGADSQERTMSMMERMKAQADAQLARAALEASWHIPVANIQAGARTQAADTGADARVKSAELGNEGKHYTANVNASTVDTQGEKNRTSRETIAGEHEKNANYREQLRQKRMELTMKYGADKTDAYLMAALHMNDVKQLDEATGQMEKVKTGNKAWATPGSKAQEDTATGRVADAAGRAEESRNIVKKKIGQTPFGGTSGTVTKKIEPAYPPFDEHGNRR